MTTRRLVHLVAIVSVLALVLAWLPTTAAQDEPVRLGMSVSTQSNPFYQNLAQGVVDEGEALGAEVTVLSADDQLEKQLSDVEDLIAAGIDVLLINPAQSEAVGVIEDAIAAGIPVITLQRAVDSPNVTSHLGTNNVLIGQLAAQWLVDKLGGQGKIVVLESIPGAASSEDRRPAPPLSLRAPRASRSLPQQTAEYNRANAPDRAEKTPAGHARK